MTGARINRAARKIVEWKLRKRTLELGRRTLIMGVVNITPDSFSDGGSFLDRDAAVAQAIRLLDDGADIVDLGAESTRPGSSAGGAKPTVSADEEQTRLLPVIEGMLAARPGAIVSVDTYKAATARAALRSGVEIVNDVSGFTWDPEMAEVCGEMNAGVVLMHTRGKPDEWRTQPLVGADELMEMVRARFETSMAQAAQAGIEPERIVFDPGYGFGKRFGENYALLARQAELLPLGRPLLAGVSRKSFLGHTLAALHDRMPASVTERETAGVAAMVVAILHGASIVRVHEVRPAMEAAVIADAVLNAG